MDYEVENRMLVDEEWDEIEYGVKRKKKNIPPSIYDAYSEAIGENEEDEFI